MRNFLEWIIYTIIIISIICAFCLMARGDTLKDYPDVMYTRQYWTEDGISMVMIDLGQKGCESSGMRLATEQEIIDFWKRVDERKD